MSYTETVTGCCTECRIFMIISGQSDIKYIINIGTWSSDLIDNIFYVNHPEITIIHIQNSVLPNQYCLDMVENLCRFDTTVDCLEDILISQFEK